MATCTTEPPKLTESDGESNQADSTTCPICYEAFTKEQRYPVTLVCGHSYCAFCVRKLNKGHKTICCCLCRRHTVANAKRLGKDILALELLHRLGLLSTEEPEVKAKPKKDSACCPACNAVDDEDMPVVVAAESSDDEDDEDDDSDQQRIFNRAVQLLYDEVFDVERALADAPNPEDSKVAKLKERLRGVQQTADKTIDTMNEASKALNSVRRQIRTLRQDVSKEGIGPSLEFRPLDLIPLRAGGRRLEDVLNFTFDEDHFFDEFNEDDVTNAIIDEQAYDDVGMDSDTDAPFVPVPEQPTLDAYMLANYFRSAERRAHNNTISRVHCYLCDIHVDVPEFNPLAALRTHVQGRRHQDLQETNRQEQRNNANRQAARPNANRPPRTDEQFHIYGTMHLNFIPNNRTNDPWEGIELRTNQTNSSNSTATRPSFGTGQRRGGGFGGPRRMPTYFGSGEPPQRSASFGNGFNAQNTTTGSAGLTQQAQRNNTRPNSGGRGGGGVAFTNNDRNRRYTNNSGTYNVNRRNNRAFENSGFQQNQTPSIATSQYNNGFAPRQGANSQYAAAERSRTQPQFHDNVWGQPMRNSDSVAMSFNGQTMFQLPPPGFNVSNAALGSTAQRPSYGFVQAQPSYFGGQQPTTAPDVRQGRNRWNSRGNDGTNRNSAEVTDRRTR